MISISTCFRYEEKQPFPICVSKEIFEKRMNLSLITEGEKKHYVLIKNFSRFMYNQSKHKERKHFCMYCLQCFSSESILAKHTNNCLTISGKQAIRMPEKGSKLKFENFHKQIPVRFVENADFEALTKKVHCDRPDGDGSYTVPFQSHEDCGYGYKVVCCYDDKFSKPVQIYRGEKSVLQKMLEEVEYYNEIIRHRFKKPHSP